MEGLLNANYMHAYAGIIVGFEEPNYVVAEGGTVTVCIIKVEGAITGGNQEPSVDIETVPATASE